MKVRELIKKLQELDPEREVWGWHRDECTPLDSVDTDYGSYVGDGVVLS